jgi:hypothetical protein
MATKRWRSISHLKLELDEEGLSKAYWLKNGKRQVVGFYCDLAQSCRGGDNDLPPTKGWYDTDGRPLEFIPAEYCSVEE